MAQPLLLAFVSSRRDDAAARWSEVTITRLGGWYTIERVGRTTLDGEVDLHAKFTSNDPREIARWCDIPARGGKPPWRTQAAIAALATAAQADPDFKAGLMDDAAVEDYDPESEPAPGSARIVLRRDGRRAIRFCGRIIGMVQSAIRLPATYERKRAVVFALDDGTFGCEYVRRAASGDALRRVVAVGVSPADVAAALCYRDGWETIAADALQGAARRDPAFVLEIDPAALPKPFTVIANGSGKVRFRGARLAAASRGDVAAVVYKTDTDTYVVGRKTGHEPGVAETYDTAADLVRAYETWTDLLTAVAAKDPAIAQLVAPETAPAAAAPAWYDASRTAAGLMPNGNREPGGARALPLPLDTEQNVGAAHV